MDDERYFVDLYEDEFPDDDVTLEDLLSSEEIEELKKKYRELEENCGITMDSLGLTNRDFF